MELPKGYTFRKAMDEDAKDVLHVVFTALQEYGLVPEPDKTDVDLKAPATFYKDGFFGVIEDPEGKIIGTFGLLEHEPGVSEIRKMYLLKEARGKGIGKFMLTFLLNKSKELGFSKAMLETASPLVEAIGLYEKYGFEEDPNIPYTERCDKMYFLDLK